MRRRQIALYGIVFFLFIAGYFLLGDGGLENWFSSESKQQINTSEIRFPEEKGMFNAFVLKDSLADFEFHSDDNFNFGWSGHEIRRPISRDIITGIAEMQLIFGAHEDKVVEVIGWYDSVEKNTSSYENLGLARAHAVKDYFILQGIPSSRIEVSSLAKTDLKPHKRILFGPVAFSIR
ncbi:MAG: OmpA family protein [Bacteroidota bacterium]